MKTKTCSMRQRKNLFTPRFAVDTATALLATALLLGCGGGGGSTTSTTTSSTATSNGITTAPATATPTVPNGLFALTSSIAAEGGALPADYTCDGASASPALAWANAPAATKEFALLMTTVPVTGSVKYNWVLSGIPANATSLARNTSGVGTTGVGSDGPTASYQAPCSQGPGAKTYTFTLYALSASPSLSVAASAVTGSALASAITSITLASTALNLNYTRGTSTTTPTTPATASTPCGYVTDSLLGSTTGVATATCDSSYAYVASNGLATHAMMNGITATNLQVPVAQNFFGANAWKIPLTPALASTTTSAVDGPIGVAINGVPIFNPCKQGGCQNGDTKVLGELDVCNGHAGRADDYHYHAAPSCLMAGQAPSYWNTHPLGWALDGFAIFGYNNADGTVASRDGVCGGNTSTVTNGPAGYSYHVTDASPYVLSCFRGTPSPDLAGQGAKFSPLRKPPVTPFPNSAMTLTTDAADGYQVLQFSSAQAFTTTATGTDSYANSPGSYKIRYKPLTGSELTTLLAANAGKTACWSFQFTSGAGATTQPATSYCR
jgi:phosphatidylethanolamine-binding protein (PEBP) family uncharacterized protein